MIRIAPSPTPVLLLVLAAWAGCKTDATQPDDFTVRPDDVALLVGESRQLSAVGAPGAVTWSSSNSAVATVVPQTGFVTAVASGVADVTAVSGSVFASAHIVVTSPPALALSAPTAEFEITLGELDPAPRTINITNGGDGTLAGIAVGAVQYSQGQTGGWLEAQLSGAVAPVTLTLTAHAATLPAGTYNAVVPLTATGVANSPQNVAVTFHINEPNSLTPLDFMSFVGGNPPALQTVAVTTEAGSGLSASIVYAQGAGWLTLTWQNGDTNAPATLIVQPNTAALARATYNATITISSTSGIWRTVPVTYAMSSFSVDIAPLFTQTNVPGYPRLPCSNCHGPLGGSAALRHQYLTQGSGGTGVVLCRISGSTCGNSMLMPPASVTLIQAWVNAGAPSN